MRPVSHGHEAHEAMPGSVLEIFHDAGHLPQPDDPRHFVAVVEDFVATTEPSTHSSER